MQGARTGSKPWGWKTSKSFKCPGQVEKTDINTHTHHVMTLMQKKTNREREERGNVIWLKEGRAWLGLGYD